MKLTDTQIQIFKDAQIEGNKFYLQGQLDRKQYTSINEVLETIGLKRSRKEKAHIADCSSDDLVQAIDDIIETGEVETLKETIKKFQFYETPQEVAEYLVELADIKESDSILEPSAGHGAILDAISKVGHRNLEYVELDKNKCGVLISKGYKYPINIDFLFLDERSFDKIIANPPFSKSQDVKHILHMYDLLADYGVLLSVASVSIKTRQGKLYDDLKNLNPIYHDLPSGSFKESGTMVNAIIVEIHK